MSCLRDRNTNDYPTNVSFIQHSFNEGFCVRHSANN